MEEIAELATLSQKINIILNSPNTSEAEKDQFRNILNNLQHRMNQLMGPERDRQRTPDYQEIQNPGNVYEPEPDQPERSYGLLV
jgi:hypothetical protein|tara:strand:- start:353 stop:604 length:252 start_codon:yes stop_codon:yes gene_type:complete